MTPHHNQTLKKPFITALAAFCLGALLANSPSYAASFSESYIPPEIRYSDDLAQKVRIPKRVNVNQASLNELMTLPGIDENIALKMMRIRPVEGILDIQRLPFLNQKQLNQIINGIQKRVEF
jgi:hypothetical protein